MVTVDNRAGYGFKSCRKINCVICERSLISFYISLYRSRKYELLIIHCETLLSCATQKLNFYVYYNEPARHTMEFTDLIKIKKIENVKCLLDLFQELPYGPGVLTVSAHVLCFESRNSRVGII